MTKKEKQLLLKDLSARLPYGVKVDVSSVEEWKELTLTPFILSNYYDDIEKIKPYLRSMSSMTEEEKEELYTAMDWYGEIDEYGNVYTKGQEKVYRETFYEYTDWLNAHHFDYCELIEKGLALEALEGMYA